MRTGLLIAGGLLALVGCWVFANLQGGFLPWFLLYAVAVLMVGEMATAWLAMRGVAVERRLSARRLTGGQPLTVEVTVRRSRRWPFLWWRTADGVPADWIYGEGPLEMPGQHLCLPLWRRTWTFTYRIPKLPRGVHTLTGVSVEAGDLFGLVTRHRHVNVHDEVVVYPQVVPVQGWTGHRPEERGMQQATRRRSEESSNVIGVRDYTPGDRLSRVHWPATARRGVLQAKEFELHVTGQMAFLPDLSRGSFAAGDRSAFELEMVIAASLIKHVSDLKRPYSALFHREGLTVLGPGVDEALLLRCLYELALAKPEGAVPFPDTLRRVVQEIPAGTTLVVISPNVGREAAVAADLARRRVRVEWFVPWTGAAPGDRAGWAALTAAGVPLHPIRSPEQLSTLRPGGIGDAAPV
ncbi:DUF58 domain-containing protein [Alicyclobacillus sp.]|uniref:DUF58 domain-containing protein n=1 Tax=Alicyclobacillus sp. TaxID=61169 RepID=UPI0025BD903C|nr:DUF58 domain-containing protein [Alicyclobacillus sp.]MCL6517988.1 DUF58 domain-containing protein [Alicyclobacillus sp.]